MTVPLVTAELRFADMPWGDKPLTLVSLRDITERHQAPRMQPPFNEQARLQAGFSAEELARLRA